AIAAAYVSEVSSLPAYPCLVFVSHGQQREYLVTLYDGTVERFAETHTLHARIAQAHGDLARAIRAAEDRHEVFDPQEHFPQAIRRVDVLVPDSALDRTGAVLVDTPGLYTRMRFGYDRMTREFRDAAACAIFVVKSDTLFLEQVFSEFQQLLELFSRIFLVVNVDSHKRDLAADGTLVPSLEQSDPDAVLRAFEQLAMSAPLQRAAREGRVRMYPVDLLQAGSAVLRKASEDEHPTGFRNFRRDLSDFLASSEYLAAFLRDSVQRGETLLREAAATAASDDVAKLEASIRDLDGRIADAQAEARAVAATIAADWPEAFARLRRELEAEIERYSRDSGAKLLRALGASVDTWFLSGHSLAWLTQGQWQPMLQDFRDNVVAAALRAFEMQQSQASAGIDLPTGTVDAMRRAGVDLRQLKATALTKLGAVAFGPALEVPIRLGSFPIKRSVLDMVTFRSVDKVRERLFGPESAPDVKIPGKEKAARLGEPGRLHLHQCITQFRGELVPQTAGKVAAHFGERFVAAAVAALRGELERYLPKVQDRERQLTAARDRLAAVAAPLRHVAATAVEVQRRLVDLGRQFEADAAAPATATSGDGLPEVVLRPHPKASESPRVAMPPTAQRPAAGSQAKA
ncbi:MAG: hypothetical protein RL398_2491, partial [Planctomycetota bacterium]